MKARGVATDGHGRLFVCDLGNKCVHMFSADGKYNQCLWKADDILGDLSKNPMVGKCIRCGSRGGPRGPGPPPTLGFEAPKLSIFGPYLIFPLRAPYVPLHAPYAPPTRPYASLTCPLHAPYAPLCAPYVPHTHSYAPLHAPYVPLCAPYVPLAGFSLVKIFKWPHHSQSDYWD